MISYDYIADNYDGELTPHQGLNPKYVTDSNANQGTYGPIESADLSKYGETSYPAELDNSSEGEGF